MNNNIDSKILNQLSETAIPQQLSNWLGKLSTFQGVPFNYLVGDDRFLPPESIKFFEVDPTWQNALMDGALSIGRHYEGQDKTSMSIIADKTHRRKMIAGGKAEGRKLRKRQLKADPEADPGIPPVTQSGFLLRSTVVNGWKSMDVIGYPQGSSPYDSKQISPLPVVRLERLSNEVLLGIFQGALYELVLHQPPEAIHFGFLGVDLINNAVRKDIRKAIPDWDSPSATYSTDDLQNVPLTNVFRDMGNRVLNMVSLSKAVAQQLSAAQNAPGYYQANPTDTNFTDRLLSSDFALEMVQGVGLVSFINDKIPGELKTTQA